MKRPSKVNGVEAQDVFKASSYYKEIVELIDEEVADSQGRPAFKATNTEKLS